MNRLGSWCLVMATCAVVGCGIDPASEKLEPAGTVHLWQPTPPCDVPAKVWTLPPRELWGADPCNVPLRFGPVQPPRLIVRPSSEPRPDCVDAVVLEVVLNREGRAESPDVLRGLGPPCDAAAIAAVSQWVWVPALWRGAPVQTTSCSLLPCEPVAVRITLAVTFGTRE
jgi:hypothetical protein